MSVPGVEVFAGHAGGVDEPLRFWSKCEPYFVNVIQPLNYNVPNIPTAESSKAHLSKKWKRNTILSRTFALQTFQPLVNLFVLHSGKLDCSEASTLSTYPSTSAHRSGWHRLYAHVWSSLWTYEVFPYHSWQEWNPTTPLGKQTRLLQHRNIHCLIWQGSVDAVSLFLI